MKPDYEAARSVVDEVLKRAREMGVRVTVAVVDAGGSLVALARMDGASFAGPEIALGKAWTAAAFGAPSGRLAESLGPFPAFTSAVSAATHGRFTPREGGAPLPGGGAVGVSGATPEQDAELAEAGAATLAS